MHTGSKYAVIYNRLPKAMLHLRQDTFYDRQKLSSCNCKQKCNELNMSLDDVRNARKDVFENCTSESEVMEFLVSKLGATKGVTTVLVGRKSVKVCRKYYAIVHAIAENKVKKAMMLARQRKRPPPRSRPAGGGNKAPVKHDVAYSFWSLFFEKNCQRPNNETRLFPTDKTYEDIYKEYFLPWFARMVNTHQASEDDRPAFSYWKAVRRSEDFKDVKERRTHQHARCPTCAGLKEMNLKAFTNGADDRAYQQKRRLHDQEVQAWRKLEAVAKAKAVSCPQDEMLIMHDGTQSMGFPRLGRRSYKNLAPDRFEITPWLAMDYSGNTKDYIYSVHTNTPKDANTLISELHAIVRRAKSDYTHVRHRARKLTIIADSASENKNNVLFAYCTDLINNRWFDSVELLFGPVGHTHNGVDATHKIHNVDVARWVSGDLGQFVNNYSRGFSGHDNEGKRMPEASILARTIDWKAYYEPCLHKLSGFTKSKNDPVCIRGFRISRTHTNTTEVHHKVDPATEEEWRGEGGYPNTRGHSVLLSVPLGLPAYVVPEPPAVGIKQVKHTARGQKLRNENMRSACRDQGIEDCVMWNVQGHVEGVIPIHAYLEAKAMPGTLGRMAIVGAMEGKRAEMRVINQYWDTDLPKERATLWALPTDDAGSAEAATSNKYHFSGDQALIDARPVPMVRYKGQRKTACPAALHEHSAKAGQETGAWRRDTPENIPTHKKQKKKSNKPRKRTNKRQQAQQDTEEDSDEDSTPDDEGEEDSSEPELSDRSSVEDSEEDIEEEPNEQQHDNDGRGNIFVEPWSLCKVGHFAAVKVVTEPGVGGPSPYIALGVILKVDNAKKTFVLNEYKSTQASWLPKCLNTTWNKGSTRQEYADYAVIHYFKKLNNNNTPPKGLRNAVEKRTWEWYQETE